MAASAPAQLLAGFFRMPEPERSGSAGEWPLGNGLATALLAETPGKDTPVLRDVTLRQCA